MSTLGLKRRRDIWRQKGQFLAVLVTVVLGVSLFAGTFNAYLNLGASLEGSYDRLAMADMTVSGAENGFADNAAAISGVAEVMERRQADLPFEIGEFSFVGRVVGLPPDGQLNQLDIDEGAPLDEDDVTGVLLETHAAANFELGVGDTFTIAAQEVTVVGIATSPEYLWPARDRQNIFTAPNSFAVAFADEVVLADVSGQTVVDQVLVLYEDGVDTVAVDTAVRAAAEEAGAADIQTLADHPSNATINLEIDALRVIAIALPLLFLAAAGMAVYVVVTRLVYSQRGVIGTLRASGFARRTMSGHYLFYGLVVGLVGAMIGAALGGLLARVMTALYTAVFGIPDLVAEFHWPTVVLALTFGAVAGVVAGVPPARAVARMAPAEAMRGDTPPEPGKRSIFEKLIPPLRRAPVRWRMSVRGIGRNKKRSASMVLGVVLGMTLILASWGMMDTMLTAMDRQFNEVAIEDASVVLSVPVDDAQVAAISGTNGVHHAERVVGLQATVRHGGESYGTILEAYESGTLVHGFARSLPPRGLLLGQATEDLLDIAVGDTVIVELPGLETQITTEVAGFVDEPLGTLVYMEVGALGSSLEAADPPVDTDVLLLPSFSTVKVLFNDGTQSAVGALRNLDQVAAVVDSNELRNTIDDFQVFFYVFIGMMLVFGGAMAFALMFNIISVNVAERAGEFASMRANGLTHRRVASLIVGETFLLTAMGIIPGLIVGYLAAVAFMSSFSSDQFPIVASMRWFTFAGASLAMFVVAGLSLLPALRAVKKINVGEIVRERAT